MIKRIEDIKIQVETIGAAGKEEHLAIAPEVFELALADRDVKVTKPLNIHYLVIGENEDIIAKINVKGFIDTFCSRCLVSFSYPINLALETRYVPANPDMPQDLEAEREDPGFGYYRNAIMLGEFILSEIIVSLPIYYVCDESCKGLCASCGVNLNKSSCKCKKDIDPRLTKLKKLKQKIQ
jgi:uncharacterized protein